MSNSTVVSTPTLSVIQQRMGLISMPIFLVLGTVGNILNCLVFLQKTLRSNSCSMYFVAASISYLLFLDFGIGSSLYAVYYGDPTTYNLPYCKFRVYFLSVCLCMARFILAFACIDRYVMCSENVRVRALSQPRIAAYVIAITTAVWILIPIHTLVYYTITNGRCTVPEGYLYFNAGYSVIIGAVLPPAIMILFSILAVRNLRRVQQRARRTNAFTDNASATRSTATGQTHLRIKQHDYQLLKMLLVDVVIYCISNVPPPISNIYNSVTFKWSKTPDQISIQNFLTYLVSQFFVYFGTSASLYTNLIISKTFRKELKSLLLRQILSTRRFVTTVDTDASGRFKTRPINNAAQANFGTSVT